MIASGGARAVHHRKPGNGVTLPHDERAWRLMDPWRLSPSSAPVRQMNPPGCHSPGAIGEWSGHFPHPRWNREHLFWLVVYESTSRKISEPLPDFLGPGRRVATRS